MSWIESSEAASRFDLDVDQSHYNVTSRYGEPVYLYTLSADCVKCPYTRLTTIGSTHKTFKINSASDYSFRFFDQDQGLYANSSANLLCELARPSGEFGAYHLVVHASGDCTVDTAIEPVNIYFRKNASLLNNNPLFLSLN